jgi:ABC-type uncharacterized transport system ATPase subunit
MLKRQYECPHFRILVIGRANAGKTTILEKVCGVAQGTNPIIYDEHGDQLKQKPRLPAPIRRLLNRKPELSSTYLTPSMEVSCMVECMDVFPLI